MNTPLGTEVDLGTGYTVLDVVPAVHERGTAPPLFAHVYCGYGRPSQLLVSSCLSGVRLCGSLCLVGVRVTLSSSRRHSTGLLL